MIHDLIGLPAWYEKLKNCGLPVYIYGMGSGCEKALSEFERHGLKCSGIFSSDDFKREREFCGHRLTTLSELETEVREFAAVLAFGTDIPEVMERIKGISEQHLLVCPDMPVTGDEFFDKNTLLSRKDDIEAVYKLLSDDISKRTFMDLLSFKISGDINYLAKYSGEDEPFKLLSLGSDEIYCDLGAYNGDTIAEFLHHTGGRYAHIYAAEPSRKNFRKCLKACAALDNITLINAAVSDIDREAFFTSGAGRQQSLSQSGTPTAVRSLDSILDGRQATYIKYDVEGEDIPAILGSAQTLKKYNPKLRISIYHRPYDILEIPLLIHTLLPSHSLYIRRKRYYPAWDTELIAIP